MLNSIRARSYKKIRGKLPASAFPGSPGTRRVASRWNLDEALKPTSPSYGHFTFIHGLWSSKKRVRISRYLYCDCYRINLSDDLEFWYVHRDRHAVARHSIQSRTQQHVPASRYPLLNGEAHGIMDDCSNFQARPLLANRVSVSLRFGSRMSCWSSLLLSFDSTILAVVLSHLASRDVFQVAPTSYSLL